MSSFSIKSLKTVITMEDGFCKTIEGLACQAKIQKQGLPQKNSASLNVWGLGYYDMAALTTLAYEPREWRRNIMEIYAGEEGRNPGLAFRGEITFAWADLNSAPDPVMHFEATSGHLGQAQDGDVLTINGEVTASLLFEQFADAVGYSYSNAGVTSSIRNGRYSGSPLDKARKLAHDIGCDLVIDDGVLLTLPKGQARRGQPVLLSPDTGLIGYPTFSQDSIHCRSLFNPTLQFGGRIEVQSMTPKASGTWTITSLTHDLCAYKPDGGAWESSMVAGRVG